MYVLNLTYYIMKNQSKAKKKNWTTPTVKGQLLINGTLGSVITGTNDAGGMAGGKS